MIRQSNCVMKNIPETYSPRYRVRLLPAIALGLVVALSGLAAGNPGKGKGKGQSPDFVPPGLADKGGVPPGLADKVPPGHRRAPVEVIVLKAPPPLRVEVMSGRPSPKHVWVPGYWIWETNSYVWLPGAWMAPPEPAAVWVTPRFETRGGVNVFISGYWRL